MSNATLSIGETILAQLGGRKFITMTGAKNLLGIASGLSFRLPGRFASQGITYVRVKLNGADLYDLEFAKTNKWGEISKMIATFEDVYASDLREIFESTTGLRTSL
jgi:hypothetical protein